MSVAEWDGVPLADAIDRFGAAPGAVAVRVTGLDHDAPSRRSAPGASWIVPLDALDRLGAFLAVGMNGRPLPPDHGAPVRLVVPGWYGCTAIKWVNEIVLMDDEAPATDHMREYAGRTHQDSDVPKLARDFRPATIDPAAVPVRVERLGWTSYRVVGLAWGGASLLSIRLNPELSWTPVTEIEASPSRPWSLWSHSIPELAPGRYRIELATRGSGSNTRRLDAGFYAREILIQGD
jgi:DMSO/TMAO reductase YedYZ molybdopterin-dependent catalytic subunit